MALKHRHVIDRKWPLKLCEIAMKLGPDIHVFPAIETNRGQSIQNLVFFVWNQFEGINYSWKMILPIKECLQPPSSCSRREVESRHELQPKRFGGTSIKTLAAATMATKFSSVPPLGWSFAQKSDSTIDKVCDMVADFKRFG